MFRRTEEIYYKDRYARYQTDHYVVFMNIDERPDGNRYWIEISYYLNNRVVFCCEYTSTISMKDAFKNARSCVDIKLFEII